MPTTRNATKGLSNRCPQPARPPHGLQPTLTAVALATMIVGSLVALERIFNYPGIGSTIFNAASKKDIPVLEASVILVAIVYMLATLAADLTIAWMNPRARVDLAKT